MRVLIFLQNCSWFWSTASQQIWSCFLWLSLHLPSYSFGLLQTDAPLNDNSHLIVISSGFSDCFELQSVYLADDDPIPLVFVPEPPFAHPHSSPILNAWKPRLPHYNSMALNMHLLWKVLGPSVGPFVTTRAKPFVMRILRPCLTCLSAQPAEVPPSFQKQRRQCSFSISEHGSMFTLFPYLASCLTFIHMAQRACIR